MTLENWSERPDGAVAFRKASLMYPPVVVSTNAMIKWVGYAGALALIFVIIRWLTDAIVAAPIVILAALLAGRQFEPSTEVNSTIMIGYWGWLTAEGGRVHSPGGIKAFHWSDATATTMNEEMFSVTFGPEDVFELEAKDIDEGRFDVVAGWLRKKSETDESNQSRSDGR
jgi:hypothetical protein